MAAMAGDLPDELWRRILEIGIQRSNLTFKDLCSVSISCRRHHRLSDESSLWSALLSSDFPRNDAVSSSASSSSLYPKSLYKLSSWDDWYEREKARRVAAHRRAVLRMESLIAERSRRVHELQAKRAEETEKIKAAMAELSHLQKVRQASVAANVWQPEIIRGRQKQIVEQCSVPVDSRVRALEMELKLCRQQIAVFDKAYRDEKQRLEAAKEQLASMKYHPLQDYSSPITSRGTVDHHTNRKKLKRCTDGANKQSGTSWMNDDG